MGQRIRKLRNHKGWTLDQLANETSVSKGFLSAIENDQNQPSGKILLKVSQALGASVDYLLSGAGAEAPETGPSNSASLSIPQELVQVAEEEKWTFKKVTALINASRSLIAKRSNKPKVPMTKHEWRDFADRLGPYIDED